MKNIILVLCCLFVPGFMCLAKGYSEAYPQTQAAPVPAIPEVSKAEFSKALTTLHKNAKEVLLVSFVYQNGDFMTVNYDGKNEKGLDQALAHAKAGDKIIVESKSKSDVPATKYRLR